MAVRAKFRCLSIKKTWDNAIICELAAVKRHGKDSENDAFWAASPNGNCELVYKTECPLVEGAYYYIDFEKLPAKNDDSWTLRERSERDHYMEIGLTWWRPNSRAGTPGLGSGKFTVGLSQGAGEGARAALQPVHSEWSFKITFAEPSDYVQS